MGQQWLRAPARIPSQRPGRWPLAARVTTVAMLVFLAMPVAPAAAAPAHPAPARAATPDSHTPAPTNVTVAGSFQSELGCSDDWLADCATTHMTYDAGDDVWQYSVSIPAGSYEYKAALRDAWDESYPTGPDNLHLDLAATTTVKFYYDHKSHWITSDQTVRIVTSPGDFQSELGCPGDWQPDCLRSWLQDIDGDGTYTFATTAIPAGDYEAKATIDETWDENYGAGGVPGGDNIPFTVPANGSTTTFSFVSATNVLTISSVAPPDDHRTPGDIEWGGLRHDSRDKLYRTPQGAVPAGTDVTIRLRTFHDDVTGVSLRTFSVNGGVQSFHAMTPAAQDVSCHQASLSAETCDFWEATLHEASANNIWYRFIVTDDADTDYYEDDTAALDGGPGAPADDSHDASWALTFYVPGFSRPGWASSAVVYQIFPDRFRNGNTANDPVTGDARYDDAVVFHPWGAAPEGYCRNYAGAEGAACAESPSGRDYQGGDLKGVIEKLDYLKQLGVNTIYFNPIFFARSNHRYDTADYLKIDPYLGTNATFTNLVAKAKQKGIRIVLDGVFNHMSSDSARFDRYGQFAAVGACESASSQWRPWFTFRPPTGAEPSVCAPSTSGGSDTFYEGWFGFDSIPVITKSLPAVQSYFLTGDDSVTKHWLQEGAAGWRLDVMGDPSFPGSYWKTFRNIVKAQDPQALIISETWQKDSTLLRMLRGDRADSTMNYRLRDAVLGLLAPQPFDPKGFADSGSPITVRQFASRMESIYEDYAPAASRALMNLLDSHDTERALWTLTPGTDSKADKELDAANLAQGKRRLRLASLIQFTVPGMPTVYYGDEVGVTGDDDPDDRRAYPWIDTGGSPDTSLLTHYKRLAQLRDANPALTNGTFETLLASNPTDTVAYGMFTQQQAGVIVINRSAVTRDVTVQLSHRIPNGTAFHRAYGVYNPTTGGDILADTNEITVHVGPLSGLLLLTDHGIDLAGPAPATNLHVTSEGDETVSLAWTASVGASTYRVYRSDVAGGGFEWIGSTGGTTITDDGGLVNARSYHYTVEAVDAAGLRAHFSNEVVATPHLVIGWANLQWPPTITHTISTTTHTSDIFGQVWIDGHTNLPGATPSLRAQVGWGPADSAPSGSGWQWVEAAYDSDQGNNDQFSATLLPDAIGTFDYGYRYTTTNGLEWLYADLDGPQGDGSAAFPNPGVLTVDASSDTTPPAVPANLHLVSASPDGVELDWDDIPADASFFAYEVLRGTASGGPYTVIASVSDSDSTDTDVVQDVHYFYVVRSVDTSFNRSAVSSEVEAVAELRDVDVTFHVTVPATTDGTGRAVYIAGTLNLLNGGLPEWDADGVVLTRDDTTHWSVTLSGREGTNIQYKYTNADFNWVEKDAGCGEIANRLLTLSYGTTGQQTVNDTVLNWRNVAPCGN